MVAPLKGPPNRKCHEPFAIFLKMDCNPQRDFNVVQSRGESMGLRIYSVAHPWISNVHGRSVTDPIPRLCPESELEQAQCETVQLLVFL